MTSPTNQSVQVVKVVSALFDQNSYLVFREGRSDCIIIDPGFESQQLAQLSEEKQLAPTAFLCTHGHADHIAGNGLMKQHWPDVPLVIGAGDASKLTDPVGNLSAGFGVELTSPPADQLVKEGDVLELAGMRFEVRESPGHSAGHIIFLLKDQQPPLVFGGDVLFSGGIGRTDFPDGSFAELKESIHEKLFTLDDSTVVYPGHGPETTVGQEKNRNPFVGLNANFTG